jgi:hypothetical protein
MLARTRTSHSRRLVSVHAASEQPAANSQAFAEGFERLKSKVDKQSILLQELLRNKEPAETVQEPAERVGVLETP